MPRPRGDDEESPDRKMVSVATSLLEDIWRERERIEANLPHKRWRSKNEYLDLVLHFGREALRGVPPLIDPLMAQWQAASNGHAEAQPVEANQT